MFDLQELSEKLVSKIDKIFEIFSLDYRPNNRRISIKCPIHDGNKNDGLTIFLEHRNGLIGNWRCWTAQCHDTYGKSILGLIYGLLKKTNPEITKNEVIHWCYNFLGEKPSYFKDDNATQKYNWIKYNSIIKQDVILPKISSNDIKSKLIIPSEYYLKRGYSKDILIKYDIGSCFDKTKEMFMRSVFPIYDDSGKYMLGCVGRSINEKCEKCSLYHFKENKCPEGPMSQIFYSKWRNSKDFLASRYFFNFWHAQEIINKNQTAILVEGQGDCLKFEEAGINISLGLFGDNLTDNQLIILEKLNLLNIIIATDNDNAGYKARETLTKKLERYYNIYYIDYKNKDAGESSVEELRKSYSKITERL